MARRSYDDGVTSITVNTDGLEKVEAAFKGNTPRLIAGLRDIGEVLLSYYHRRFDTRGDGSWPDLEPNTKTLKEAAGYNPSAVLVATSQLQDALDPANRGAPGQKFIINTNDPTGPSITVGYGGTAKYEPGDENYAKGFTWGGGTIASLAEIHQSGSYRSGKSREIIVVPDSQTLQYIKRKLEDTVNDIIDEGNATS